MNWTPFACSHVSGCWDRSSGVLCTYYSKNPVDPSVPRPVRDKSHEERGKRNAQRQEQGPDAHIPTPIFLEKRLRHHRASNRSSRRDEPRRQRPTRRRRGVVRALRTSHIADQTANQGKKEDWASAKAVGQRLPEQRRTTQDCNLQRGQVTRPLHGNPKLFRNSLVRGDDASCDESAHASVERHKQKIDEFLDAWSAAESSGVDYENRHSPSM